MKKRDPLTDANNQMWRGALIPATVLSVVSIITALIVRGSSGMNGALLASFIVLIFFSVSLFIARLTRNVDPIGTMALAMFSYFTKLLLIAGFLIAVTHLTSPESVDRTSFGSSAIAISFAWLAGEVRAFFRLRLQLPLPESSITSTDTKGRTEGR